jgi:hypothetical protein
MRAVRDAGRDDEVLPFKDDLSCGPIEPDDPSVRASWWAQFYNGFEVEDALRTFWGRVSGSEARLVVWFGRHSARELAFFLAWTDRLGERAYQIVDVTGQRLPFRRQDGSAALGRPAQSVSIVPSDGLRSLLGKEQRVTAHERKESQRDWRRLRRENAPFRIVTETGLVSASIDYFDPLLLAQATSEWQSVARVVMATIGYDSEPYLQAGDLMLLTRIAALVGGGKLIADGNPWNMSCRIRLPS